MRRLLVTGGAGFIGANYVRRHARTHPDDTLVVLDALTYAGNRASLAPLDGMRGFTFVQGDITDTSLVDTLLREYDIDTIVHFAAESHVDRSIADPGVFVRTNVLGTQVLLDAAMRAWSDGPVAWRPGVRFHHVSTDEVYGSLEPGQPAFTESSPYAPSSPYAASKAGSDHLVRAYARTYGLPVGISNCSNNYGPLQFPEKLVPLLIVNALHGRPLPVYGDGLQVRDWLFVDDHCAAIDRLLDADVRGRTYNVGGRAEHPNLHIVDRVCALLDERLAASGVLRERYPACPASQGAGCIELRAHVTDRRGHDRRYAIDPSRLEREVGFSPAWRFDAGLAHTVDWYLANDAWWRAVLDGSYRR